MVNPYEALLDGIAKQIDDKTRQPVMPQEWYCHEVYNLQFISDEHRFVTTSPYELTLLRYLIAGSYL
jgi:hypothetical protein